MRKMIGVRQGALVAGIGLCLLLAGVSWLAFASPTAAQTPTPGPDGEQPPNLGAAYVGAFEMSITFVLWLRIPGSRPVGRVPE